MRILYVTRHHNHSGYLILEALINEGFDIVGVLLKDEHRLLSHPIFNWVSRIKYSVECAYYGCQPLKTQHSEEMLARKNKLNILKTDSIKSESFYKKLKDLNPDIIVLGGGWPELIPERVFSFPRLGCINTHPSLLPEFKGTSITRWQILHGVEKSGSTIHYVNDKFDEGGVLAQRECPVIPEDTPQELFYKLGKLGASMMVPLLRKFEKEGRQVPYEVEHNKKYYNYYSRWRWSLEKLVLDWEKPLRDIHFFVKSSAQESYKYLGPTTNYNGKKYIIRVTGLSKAMPSIGHQKNLTVLARNNKTITIGRKGESNGLELVKMQRGGKFFFLHRAKDAAKVITEDQGEILNFS